VPAHKRVERPGGQARQLESSVTVAEGSEPQEPPAQSPQSGPSPPGPPPGAGPDWPAPSPSASPSAPHTPPPAGIPPSLPSPSAPGGWGGDAGAGTPVPVPAKGWWLFLVFAGLLAVAPFLQKAKRLTPPGVGQLRLGRQTRRWEDPDMGGDRVGATMMSRERCGAVRAATSRRRPGVATLAVALMLAACSSSTLPSEDSMPDSAHSTDEATSTTDSDDQPPTDAGEQSTTPYVDDGYTVIDASNLFGASPCQTQGSFVGALSSTQFVIDCDQGRYIGVDIDSEEVMWTAEIPPAGSASEDERALNTKAALVAFLDTEIEQAAGFEEERRDVAVRAWSLEDGTEQYKVTLPRPKETIDETMVADASQEPSLEVMGPDGTVIASMPWPILDGGWVWMLYGIAPDGSIAWQRESSQYVFLKSNAQSREYVYLLHRAGQLRANETGPVISIQTGDSAIPDSVPAMDPYSDAAYGDGCSSIFLLQSGSPPILTVLDASTGQAHTIEIEHDDLPGAEITPSGVIFSSDEDAESVFIGPEGEVWRHPPRVSSYAQVKFGRLFMENQSGTLLEVDQATGEPLSESEATLPPYGHAVEGGVVVIENRIDGVGLRFEETEILCG
jgi:hypothetical protein